MRGFKAPAIELSEKNRDIEKFCCQLYPAFLYCPAFQASFDGRRRRKQHENRTAPWGLT